MSDTTSKNDQQIRREILELQSVDGRYVIGLLGMSNPYAMRALIEYIKQYGIQERIDEGKILNMRVSTARTDEPKLKDYTDGYNLCRRSLTQEIRKRNAELTALRDTGADTRISNDRQETK